MSGSKTKVTIQDWLLDPDKGLFQHKFFWIMTLSPVLAGLILGWFAWRGYSVDLSATGYAVFLEISKLPLGIMALGIPFGAVVAGFHRAVQTAKQIKIAESNNLFKNYIDHKKYFIEDSIDNLYKGNHALRAYALRAYDFFFFNAMAGDFRLYYSPLVCRIEYNIDTMMFDFEQIGIFFESGSDSYFFDSHDYRDVVKGRFIDLIFHRLTSFEMFIDEAESIANKLKLDKNFRNEMGYRGAICGLFDYFYDVYNFASLHEIGGSSSYQYMYITNNIFFEVVAYGPHGFFLKETDLNKGEKLWSTIVDILNNDYSEIFEAVRSESSFVNENNFKLIIHVMLIASFPRE
ncbi:hypothetical protein [Nitrincola sp. MINF-07-Sa-05]|uniref:hypothetical protein n=1 Tax=Nitrincola salilacus TaxID=3400273 RepID=UPI00391804FA